MFAESRSWCGPRLAVTFSAQPKSLLSFEDRRKQALSPCNGPCPAESPASRDRRQTLRVSLDNRASIHNASGWRQHDESRSAFCLGRLSAAISTCSCRRRLDGLYSSPRNFTNDISSCLLFVSDFSFLSAARLFVRLRSLKRVRRWLWRVI